MQTHIDHLVVAAHSLQEGVEWCEATLGITPGAGGEHPLFGTHNRLFRIATVNYPRAYFEIIALHSGASRSIESPAKCWFDLDSSGLQEAIKTNPRLVHFVANTTNVSQACAALKEQGIDRGPAVQASRMTPAGLLQWQITVREDGRRLFNGCMPTLIEWGDVHPANTMPDSGVFLQDLRITHPQATELKKAFQALSLQGCSVEKGVANLMATLQTPKGLVTLESKGI